MAGRRLVHLQGNAGQDSLNLVRRGAVVTGLDISDTAIAFARALSEETGLPATFHRADVYKWLDQAGRVGERFDIAFCSYGALCWLSDVGTWARGIAAILRPGGRVVVVDFQPFLRRFDEGWRLAYPSFQPGATSWEEGVGDYVAMAGEALTPSRYVEGVRDFKNPHRSHEVQWGIGEIVTAFLEAGLPITALREYPYSNGAKLFDGMRQDGMRETPGRRMVPPEGVPNLP